MNVAILHYHFDRGGVTRVVASTLGAFAGSADFRFGLISGRPVGGMTAPSILVPALDYADPAAAPVSPGTLHSAVIAAGKALFGGREPDLWHIHNPALGKNPAMTGLVARLAREGRALLLHAHDFAEDFRPANYRLREETRDPDDPVFPFSPRIGFATINRRDRRILRGAGLPEECSFPLPNPVPRESSAPPPEDKSNRILYPVRALARKNLGEFLLLAHCHRDRLRFETTLPPTNAAYRRQFERWKQVAADLELPASLGVAETDDLPFAERMAGCRAVLTTSVAEGFGLAFLEPWVHGRAVAGRDLPEITGEFREAGLAFDGLYEGFPVPADLLPCGEAARAWREAIESAYRSFGVETPPHGAIRRIEEEIRTAAAIDFALLGEDLQEKVLRTLGRGGRAIDPPDNLTDLPPASAIAANRTVVLRRFGAEGYADRLRAAYGRLAAAPAESPGYVDPGRVRDGFLDPGRFVPHRVG